MSASTNTGGPAYPQPLAIDPSGSVSHSNDWSDRGGMTLLDHFAGLAMQPMVERALKEIEDGPSPNSQEESETRRACSFSDLAWMAYNIAEAMIGEKREREGA